MALVVVAALAPATYFAFRELPVCNISKSFCNIFKQYYFTMSNEGKSSGSSTLDERAARPIPQVCFRVPVLSTGVDRVKMAAYSTNDYAAYSTDSYPAASTYYSPAYNTETGTAPEATSATSPEAYLPVGSGGAAASTIPVEPTTSPDAYVPVGAGAPTSTVNDASQPTPSPIGTTSDNSAVQVRRFGFRCAWLMGATFLVFSLCV